MFRVSMANALAKRTLKPLYEQRQATPWNTFLDSAETGNVYSGMVATRSGADKVVICDGATQLPFGLFALDKNAVINDLDGFSDILPIAVYLGGPDALFQVFAPAFDTTANWLLPAAGARKAVYAGTGAAKGLLTTADPAAAVALPIGELIDSTATSVTIRVLIPPAAATPAATAV